MFIDILSLLVLTFSPVNLHLLHPFLLIMYNFYHIFMVNNGITRINRK